MRHAGIVAQNMILRVLLSDRSEVQTQLQSALIDYRLTLTPTLVLSDASRPLKSPSDENQTLFLQNLGSRHKGLSSELAQSAVSQLETAASTRNLPTEPLLDSDLCVE